MQRRPRHYVSGAYRTHPEGRPGDDYELDEVEFMLAMDKLQRRLGRKIAASDPLILHVATGLGYRQSHICRGATGGRVLLTYPCHHDGQFDPRRQTIRDV